MKRTAWIASGVVAMLVLAAALWWGLREAEEAPQYRTAALERGPLQAAVSAAGTVKPVVQVTVGSQVSGQIAEILADFNTEVKKGQLIARIDAQTFHYKVRQAQADLDAARAQVLQQQAAVAAQQAAVSRAQLDADNAQRDLQRKQGLLDQNFISPAEYDTAQNVAGTFAEQLKAVLAQLDVSRAQAVSAVATVKQREAALAQAQVDLDRTDIRSPVDGVVIKRSVDVGQTVAASLQAPELFLIARNLSDMQVEVLVDEADIGRVRPGQAASFAVDAFPGRSYEGTVATVRKASTSNNNVVTYTVVVAFANRGAELLPGMTANVRMVTDSRDDVLKLPNAALRVRLPNVAEPSPTPVAASAASAPGAPAAGRGFEVARGDAPHGAGRHGPLAAFRAGLQSEVGLTPAQLQKVDALSSTLRPKLAALRGLPEDERARGTDRVRAELHMQVAALLTPDQKPRYERFIAESSGQGPAVAGTRGRIYVLQPDGRPQAVSVRLGISDGSVTELLAPRLAPGTTVIVGAPPPSASRGPTGPRPPF
jgi:HlyD family secretion protein